MAHTARTPARIQRLSALVAIVAVAVAIGFAFGRILLGHSSTYRMLAVGVVSGVIAWATERRGMLLATLGSAAGLLLVLAWMAAPHTLWFGLPTAETLRTLATLATQVGAQAREYVSPAPATPSLVLAGVIAVWAAVFSCYALAFRAQSPLLALVPPLALIVFADGVLEEFERPLYGVVFLLAALAVLFADGLRRIQGWGPVWSPTGNRDRLLPAAGRNARRVGLTAVALAALAPVLVPGFGTRPVLDLTSINSDGRIRVSPLVSLGSILNDSEDNRVELFRVQADRPSYWRMVALEDFSSGTTWEARPDDGIPLAPGDAVPGSTTQGEPVTQVVKVTHDLGFAWLVAAADPTAVSIDHDVAWHPASSSLQMDGWPDEGEGYTVTSVRSNPSVKDLRAVRASLEGAALTQLPDNIPPLIAERALEWTAGATSDFDKVMAIVDHLTSGEFDYRTDVAFRDDPQTLADMLTSTKAGFCQQFASLMAVMLRELGIPARVALGFTQGTPVGDSTWAVTTRNYHSWVEVPFEGFGWLTFDPTPGFVDPAAAGYQSIFGPDEPTCPTQGRGCENTAGTGNGGGQHNVKGGTLNEQPGTGGGGISPPASAPIGRRLPLGRIAAAAAIVLCLIAIAIPAGHAARRRRRLRTAHDPRDLVLATYDVFAERAGELGWRKRPGETPNEFRRRLGAHGVLGDAADPAMARLTSAVVRAAYAPTAPGTEAVDAAELDAASVLRELRDATSLRQRVLGIYRRD